VRTGEIVGLCGLVGSGRTEVARAIFGADRVTSGEIRLFGAPIGGSIEDATIRGMAFFPLTIPLTTGPGTIATAIAISTNRPADLDALFALSAVWLVIALAVSATIYHAYRKSGAMARLFGEEGTSVITRLSAFLLLCIGAQIMITGVTEIGRSIHDAPVTSANPQSLPNVVR